MRLAHSEKQPDGESTSRNRYISASKLINYQCAFAGFYGIVADQWEFWNSGDVILIAMFSMENRYRWVVCLTNTQSEFVHNTRFGQIWVIFRLTSLIRMSGRSLVRKDWLAYRLCLRCFNCATFG